VGIDGEIVSPGQNLKKIIQDRQPGDEITLELDSTGDEENRELEVTLGEHPDETGRAYLGVSYRTVPDVSLFEKGALPFNQFALPDNGRGDAPFFQGPFEFLPFGQDIPELPEGVEQAVIVRRVISGSPAEEAGLQPGDLVTAANGDEIGEPKALAQLIESKEPGDEITLTVYRAGEAGPLEIQATLGEHPDEAGLAYLGVTISGFTGIELRSPDLPDRFRYFFESPWPGDPSEPGPEA
jgi:S1-C subfamily serine protease